MDDFKERLLSFIAPQYGDSQRGFERRFGFSQETITSIGAKGPSVDVLHKVFNSCPELNLTWLVIGEGNMLNSGSSTTITAKASSVSSANVNIGNKSMDSESVAVLRKEIEMLRAQLADKDEQIQFLKSPITK